MQKIEVLSVLLLCFSALAVAKLTVNHEKTKSIRTRSDDDALKVLFECDFDDGEWEIEYDEDDLINGTPMFTVNQTLATGSGYLITDFSSITKPTANGELCTIPFNLNGQLYYHCNSNNQCQTSSGLSKCTSGSFLNGKFSIAEQRNTLYFPVLSDYYHDALYELSFAALMYCEGDADCEKSNDIIQVGVYSIDGDSLVKPFKTVKMSDFDRTKSWQKFSLKLPDIDNAYYIEVVFVKDFYSTLKSTTYYGLDNIEIKLVETYHEVFHCSFDTDDCEFGYLFGHDKFQNIDVREKIILGSNVFTDVSSTSQPTSNSQICKIPYYDSEKIRYHCNADNQCETEDGLSDCALGRFLGGYTNNSVSGFFIERSDAVQFLPEASVRYLLSYQVFMYCDGSKEACDKSTDYMLIFVQSDEGMMADANLKLKDFDGAQGWKKIKSEFRTENPIISINFEIGRFSYNDATTFFGIDEFRIDRILSNTETTTTTTTTSIGTTTTPTLTSTTTTTATTTKIETATTTASITTKKPSKSDLGVILPAVLVPVSVLLVAGISAGFMYYFKKGCFGKTNMVGPDSAAQYQL